MVAVSRQLGHPPYEIIRRLLIDLSLGTDGTVTDWPIYAPSAPNEPASIITVAGTESVLSGRDMNSGEMAEHYGVNINVRSEDVVTGEQKARDIADAMDSTVDRNTVALTSPTRTYQIEAITRRGGVLHTGKEIEGRREIFSLNLLVAMYRIL